MAKIVSFVRPTPVTGPAESSDLAQHLRDCCPEAQSAGAMWLEGGLHGSIADHVQGCAPCRAEIALAQAFAAAGRPDLIDLEVERIRRRLAAGPKTVRRWMWLSAAAAALVAAASLSSWLPPPVVQPPDTEVWRSASIEIQVGPALRQLEWSAVDGAAQYRVIAEDGAGAPLAELLVEHTTIELEERATAVRVEALDAGGRILARGYATVTSSQR